MYHQQFEPNSYYYPEPEPKPQPSFLKRVLHLVREVLETIVPAVLIALLINLFLAQATRVYGQSMEPNLHTDQRLVVEKLSYNRHIRQLLRLSGPERGDVVVIRLESQGDELLIKRVIGLPGDVVEIHDGLVFVNGQPLNEPYVAGATTTGFYAPTTIPPLQIFVLGDNRGFSNDSRSFGTIPLEDVVGRAWFSYWPPEQIGFVK
ncbi:MAG: signal peptidase I [Anaerolineae bacterium]|nr:signal peptidase I [Anaerolineales bacterium]MCQ3978915.1 signal peptidase I [Anaerolineae bacterium]